MNISEIQKAWNIRSSLFKDSLNGVLLASFPEALNKVFHNWHLFIINKFFYKSKKKVNVLDLGCGYGRISYPLSKTFNNACFHGVDITKEYIDIYNKKLKGRGEGTLDDIKNLKIKNKKFDCVIIVTILIYLKDKEIKNLSEKLSKLSNKDTVLIVIENCSSGTEFLNNLKFFNKLKKIFIKNSSYSIDSRSFKSKQMIDYFNKEFYLYDKKRCSVLTTLMPLLFIISKLKIFNIENLNIHYDLPFLPSLYEAHIFKLKHNV